MKKIAIIGANEAINKLILKAKSLGYETHVFAWECGDPGEKTADYFYPIDIANKEKVYEECKKIEGLNGVASVTSDFAVNTVNYVARKLGLPCNSEITDKYARNKFLMRCAFKEAGLYVPDFMRVSNDKEFESARAHFENKFPVIVKPTDRWSSKGVTRVDSIDEFASAIEYAQRESLTGEAIVEGFMNGPEYSCECICYNGKYDALQITKKDTTGYPHYIETGHTQPSGLNKEEINRVKKVVFKALEALDIKNSAAHAEFRLLDDGNIGLIEIGARMGGDCIGTDLVCLSTGYDYLRMILEVACGQQPTMDLLPHYNQSKVKFLLNQDDYNKYIERKNTGTNIVLEYDISNDFNKEILDSSTRNGYYIFVE